MAICKSFDAVRDGALPHTQGQLNMSIEYTPDFSNIETTLRFYQDSEVIAEIAYTNHQDLIRYSGGQITSRDSYSYDEKAAVNFLIRDPSFLHSKLTPEKLLKELKDLSEYSVAQSMNNN